MQGKISHKWLIKLSFFIFSVLLFTTSCTKCMECTYQVAGSPEPQKLKKCARKEELDALELAMNQEYTQLTCKPVSK